MKRLALSLLIAAALAGAPGARAQMLVPIDLDTHHAGAAAYVGPGDVAPLPGYWGVRGYTAAIAATGTQQAFTLQRWADDATCIPLIATNGWVDLTVGTPCSGKTVTAWAGGNATCTGAIGPASTTFTVTSCTGTLAVGEKVTGTGVAANTYLTAVVGDCTATSSCTVNNSQTVASETLTMVPSVLGLRSWVDQPNNVGAEGQTNKSYQAKLIFSGIGGKPDFNFVSASTNYLVLGGSVAVAPPWTSMAVGKQATGTYGKILFVGHSSLNWGGVNSAGIQQDDSNGLYATAADGAPHSLIGIIDTTSALTVDGVTTTAVKTKPSYYDILYIGGQSTSYNINAELSEVAIVPTAGLTPTQIANLCHNQYLAYGSSFTTAC